jgi:hypothetical protein
VYPNKKKPPQGPMPTRRSIGMGAHA